MTPCILNILNDVTLICQLIIACPLILYFFVRIYHSVNGYYAFNSHVFGRVVLNVELPI